MSKLIFKGFLVLMFLTGSISLHAQKQRPANEKAVVKSSMREMPAAVKTTLDKYSSRKFDQKITYTREKNGKLYKVKVVNDQFVDYILIDESGKVKGIVTGEGRKRS